MLQKNARFYCYGCFQSGISHVLFVSYFKVGCVFPVVVSILPQSEFGRNDHREDALHFKGSPNPSHLFFEINVGKGQIRQRTTLHLNDVISNRVDRDKSSSNSIAVLCRIRPFPTLISKNKWLGIRLPLSIRNQLI